MMSKYKKVLAIAAALVASGAVHAQSAGSNVISAGWLRVMPTGNADPLDVQSVNVAGRTLPGPGVVPNTGATMKDADTFGLSYERYVTDNIGVELVLGIPPTHDVEGSGVLAQFGKLGSVKQWSPALLVKYHFFDAKAKFRPYVGLGVNYTWYTDETVTNQQFVQQFAHGTSMSASASPSWNPVFNIGANYALSDHWYLGFSVSYLPVKTDATFTTSGVPITVAPGVTVPGQTVAHTRLAVNPVVTFLTASYKF